MLWGTKLLDIQLELIIKDMLEMPFILIYVLFVILGLDPSNTNQWLKNLQSIWFVYNFFLCFSPGSLSNQIYLYFQIMMEDETGFLSKEDENKTRIQDLLMKVLQDLNEKQVTTIVGKFH